MHQVIMASRERSELLVRLELDPNNKRIQESIKRIEERYPILKNK